MSGGEKTVCVTGASGFIASWLVKLLLQRGYTVKATVLDLNDPKHTEHLLALDGAKERLRLFRAELLEEGCFDQMVDGCEGVFHTASPVFLSPPDDPQAELIDPAVKGTLNVLKSCAKVASVKRVVFTSSMGAVIFNGNPLSQETVVDETWVSDPVYCKNKKQWYMLSKTLAEEAALKFAKDNGINLVTVNPGLVIGPLLQPILNATAEVVLNIINGKDTLLGTVYRFVDVRDVADAHLKAFKVPSASGRYILVGKMTDLKETLKILRQLYPSLILPQVDDRDKECRPVYQVSQEKAKSLGVQFTPVEVSLRDTVESLKEKGFLSV